MQHVVVLLTIIILLVVGFFTLTGVIMILTEDPTKWDTRYKEELQRKEYRKKFYKLESSEENELEPKFFTLETSLPNVRTRWTTVPTIPSTEATTPATTTTEVYEFSTQPLTKRPMRVSPVTVKVNHTVFHGIERVETEHHEVSSANFDLAQLHLIHEIKVPGNEKISTLLIHNSLLYLPLTVGDILIYNLSTYDIIKTYKTSLALHHLGFLDGNIIATEVRKNTLSVLDEEGRVEKQLKLTYDSKDMQVFEKQIFVLSRSNQDIFVYDKALNLRNTIHFDNEIQETCNFILPTANAIYVSCQSSILQLSSDGNIVKKLAAPGGSYSLGIGIYDDSIFAVKRGEQEIHAFEQGSGELKTKLINNARGSAIWSSLAFNSTKMYALEYITNIVKVFLLP